MRAELERQWQQNGTSPLVVLGAASATLSSFTLDAQGLAQVERAHILVLSSPFAVDSVLAQIEGLLLARQVKPILAVMGPGSAQALQKYPQVMQHCGVVYPLDAPFDAMQLSVRLRQCLAEYQTSNALLNPVAPLPSLVVLQGNRSATSPAQWHAWLGDCCKIATLQVYCSETVDQAAQLRYLIPHLSAAQINDIVVYFTTSSSVKPFADAWRTLASEQVSPWGKTPSLHAVSIHEKISVAAVQHLKWPSVVIEPGLSALINYLK